MTAGIHQRAADAALTGPQLTALDLACGVPLGFDTDVAAPLPFVSELPVKVLEEVLTRALETTPCLMSFSGGRDSSALLAVAARVARREGLALPIPVTLTFPGDAAADEQDWQALVLEHLGLPEWVRHEVRGDELDTVGPVARDVLRRHGLLWPFNTHFHAPLLAYAAGGSLVTGFGGDELGRASAQARAARLLTGRDRARPRDLLALGLALSPRPLRRIVYRQRQLGALEGMPWLTPVGRAPAAKALADADARTPLGWPSTLRTWIPRNRYFVACQRSFTVLGNAHDVVVHHPFVDSRLLGALASAGGFAGFGTRTQFMNALFADSLPQAVVRRSTKGGFTSPAWTQTARKFAASWSGEGLPSDLVDGHALRRHWATQDVNLMSAPLLQAAWLHDTTGASGFIA